MPNWVFNNLNVSGNKDKLEEFKNLMGKSLTIPYDDEPVTIEKPVFSFLNAFPPTAEEYAGVGWYDWNIKTFGCKWDVYSKEISGSYLEEVDGDLMYSFESPWSPPTLGIQKLAQMFPELEFNFEYEEENGWGGEVVYRNGKQSYFNEWDEPASHADFVAHPYRECYCQTQPEESEFRFEDCPKVG